MCKPPKVVLFLLAFPYRNVTRVPSKITQPLGQKPASQGRSRRSIPETGSPEGFFRSPAAREVQRAAARRLERRREEALEFVRVRSRPLGQGRNFQVPRGVRIYVEDVAPQVTHRSNICFFWGGLSITLCDKLREGVSFDCGDVETEHVRDRSRADSKLTSATSPMIVVFVFIVTVYEVCSKFL